MGRFPLGSLDFSIYVTRMCRSSFFDEEEFEKGVTVAIGLCIVNVIRDTYNAQIGKHNS